MRCFLFTLEARDLFLKSEGCALLFVRQYTNSVAPEPTSSSPYSQEPATGPYPQPTGPLYTHPANLPKIYSDPILLSIPWSSM
jgi:hypothetical protein